MIEIIEANLVSLRERETYPVRVTLTSGKITKIEKTTELYDQYLIPGFVDSHVHIESSLMTPANFAASAIRKGVIGAVADPHEIANVMGVPGIDFMIENGKQTPFYFWFGLPSCIPSTSLENSGATINADDTAELMKRYDLHFLGEMMNYPGVLSKDSEVIKKIEAAKANNKPIDGHAPALSNEDISTYAAAGISTDHECTTLEEAIYKIQSGMKVLIREGSAARNFDNLHPLYTNYPTSIMLCTDDMPASTLLEGYLHKTVVKALSLGYDLYDVLRSASLNTIEHYKMPIGLLQEGDSADFLVVKDLCELEIEKVYIKGNVVFDANGQSNFNKNTITPTLNKFNCLPISPIDLHLPAKENKLLKTIDCICGDLTTEIGWIEPKIENNNCVSNPELDQLKMVAMSRYVEKELAVGFIRGIGLKRGAMATSISHDNHNIVAVGCTDAEICLAINTLIGNRGGMVVVDDKKTYSLPLEIAGLMTNLPAEELALQQAAIKNRAIALGSTLEDPFLTLAFMSLIVIPKIKLSSNGLFDVEQFKFTSIYGTNLDQTK